MKQKKNGFFITILLLLISLAFIVTVSVVFNNIKTNLEREIISSLSEEAEENAALIEKEIDAKFGVLQSFANELSSTGDEIAEIRDMQSFVEVYNFKRMGFIDLNGIAKTTDGFEKDLSFREFYQIGLKGESFITASLLDTVGDHTEDMINILSVPVYDNKGEIKGVLFATYLTEKFHETIFSDSFQGEGYTYIVAGDGDVISSYGDGMQKEYDNIFIYTGDAAQYGDVTQEKVENDMREKLSRVGIGVNEDNDKYFYCYKPLEIESADMNWYIFSVEPKSVLDERMHPIMRDIQFLTVILIGILVMANIIFLYYNVRRRQELFRLAYKDSITGGDNFSNFKEKAKKYENTEGYVIALDISEFKLVNNVCGNASGDEVLKVIWDVILANCNDNEQAARVNADRFVIFWIESSKKTVTYRIEKLINEIEGISEQLSVPRLYPVIGIRAVEKLDDADKRYGEALRAKALVKNRRDRHYAFYDEIDYDTIVENKNLENGFEKALADKKFEVWYQPKFNSHTGKIVGSEALIRWRADDGSLISPGRFIPLFEKNGNIIRLDEYVFREVCRQQKEWQKEGIQILPVSVNISRFSLYYSNVVEKYERIINYYDVDHKYVQIEITESAIIENTVIVELIQKFHDAGFDILLDDFGSGYSSLASLNQMPFDTIKLDKSLVDYVGNENGEKLLKFIVQLVQSLGMKITAEGVEYKEQLDFLENLNCDDIQGFYFSKPLMLADFSAKLTENN
ncbi:MAG: EAL domain-containing protein [Lachnospira sp.]|nr:EAL domain-containing protein [Lachnospira sp.]